MRRLAAVLTLSLIVFSTAWADEKEELDKLKGSWEVTKAERGGEAFEEPVGDVLTFDGAAITVTIGGDEHKGTAKIDATTDPKSIQLTPDEDAGHALLGIYKFDNEALILCMGPEKRPEKFDSSVGEGVMLMTLKKKTD